MDDKAVFSMEMIDTEKITQEIENQEQLIPEEVCRLKEQAENNAIALFNMDMDSLKDKKQFASSIEQFGLDTMFK